MVDILVVDDDDIIRDTLCELLSMQYRCETAATAEAALSQLATQSFDLVITDVRMPGLSGSELLRKLLESQPDIPVIIISGLTDQEQAERFIELGAVDYLLKPFRLEVVEASVKRALEKRQLAVPGQQ